MIITYSIQKHHFFFDQFEEKGVVILQKALCAFSDFPFIDLLTQAKKSKQTYCLPKIIFNSDDDKRLEIWAQDECGFYFHFENSTHLADVYLTNEICPIKKQPPVEDYIELFFLDRIEENLNLMVKLKMPHLEAILSKAKLDLNFNDYSRIVKLIYANKWNSYHNFWWIPFFLISSITISYTKMSDIDIALKIYLALSIIWLPSAILYFTYRAKNYHAVVLIDKYSKTLTYKKGESQVKFSRNEILKCEIHESQSFRKPWRLFRYLKISLKDNRQIIITNFISEPAIVIESLGLNFLVIRRFMPFLPIIKSPREQTDKKVVESLALPDITYDFPKNNPNPFNLETQFKYFINASGFSNLTNDLNDFRLENLQANIPMGYKSIVICQRTCIINNGVVVKKWEQAAIKTSNSEVKGRYCIYTNRKLSIFVKSWNSISQTYSIPRLSGENDIYAHLWENYEDVDKFANALSVNENVAVMVCKVVDFFGWH